jgi:hypothetical protein
MRGRIPGPAPPSVVLCCSGGDAREVQFAERLLDEAALVGVVERLARDLLGGQHREIGDLTANVVERPLAGGLDVALGALGSFLEDLLATLTASCDSALWRARWTISSDCARASFKRSRYSSSTLSASLRRSAAASISPSIVFARLSRASPISGNTHLLRMNSEIANTTIVQIMIPTFGVIRNEPLEEASGVLGAMGIWLAYRKKAMKPPTRP